MRLHDRISPGFGWGDGFASESGTPRGGYRVRVTHRPGLDPAVAEKDAQASREIKTFKDLPAATTAFDGVLAKITAA